MNSSKGKASTSTVVVSAVALVACVGAGYAIAQNTGERDPQQTAAASAEQSVSKTVVPTAPSESAPAPSSAPEEPAKITVESPTTSASATPSKVAIAGSGASSAASESSRWASPTPYTRPPVSVVSTTIPLPPEAQELVNAQEGGPIIGREETTQAPTTVPSPSAREDEDEGEGQLPARNIVDDGDTEPARAVTDVAAERQSPEQEPEDDPRPDTGETVADPQPAPAAAPAPVVEEEPVAEPVPEPAPAPPAPPAPAPVSEAELDATFRAAFAPGASDAQLAAAFESGPAMIPVGRVLADGLPMLGGAVQWHLAGITGVGDTASGQLVITTPLGQQVVPMTWIRQDGQWKISTSSTCDLGLALLGGCNPA
jgi:hypothetical protein